MRNHFNSTFGRISEGVSWLSSLLSIYQEKCLQQILLRSDLSLETYSLKAVTYDTSSASFLTIGDILQFSNDCAESRPGASRIIANYFYVNDLLTGSDSITDLIHRCQKKTNILLKVASHLANVSSIVF